MPQRHLPGRWPGGTCTTRCPRAPGRREPQSPPVPRASPPPGGAEAWPPRPVRLGPLPAAPAGAHPTLSKLDFKTILHSLCLILDNDTCSGDYQTDLWFSVKTVIHTNSTHPPGRAGLLAPPSGLRQARGSRASQRRRLRRRRPRGPACRAPQRGRRPSRWPVPKVSAELLGPSRRPSTNYTRRLRVPL